MSIAPPLAVDRRPRSRDALPQRRLARIVPDKRKYRRVPVALEGRFMRETREDYPCTIVDMSAGGMALRAPIVCEDGERIVAYIDVIGRLEAIVVRPIASGFAARILASQHKREKIVNQLTWIINRDRLGLGEGRQHERVMPKKAASSLILPNGETFPCQVIDVSLSGASVACEVRPQDGAAVVLGRMRGKVVRHHARGVAIQFADLQDPDSIARSFG